jgi:hypothetical protein
VRYGRYRTVAFDGCTSIKTADSDRNQSWLGKLKAALGVTGYPAVELMTLAGDRHPRTARRGARAQHDRRDDYARRLLRPDMLVLADRGFDASQFLQQVAAAGAQFLVRLRNSCATP